MKYLRLYRINYGDTKLEKYKYNGYEFFVIRDDLKFPFPSPNFSKIRGLKKYFEKLHNSGVKVVASQDTIISRVGWGVAYFAKMYDMKHYSFYPQGHYDFYRRMTEYFGSELIPLRGNRASIFKFQAEKYLAKIGVKNYHYIPVGLRLYESKTEHMNMVENMDLLDGATLIVCVSSGTIASGILAGILKNNYSTNFVGVLVHNFKKRYDKILNEAKQIVGVYKKPKSSYNIVDYGFKYNQKAKIYVPFPCDEFLDRKAFQFMIENINRLPEPVVFWNIGGEWSPEKGLNEELRGDGIVTKSRLESMGVI